MLGKEMYNPLISVIMPAYNAENTIRKSVLSVLNQSYTNFELIICDDGSTDETKKIILTFSDARIKFINNKYEKGAAGARNSAIDICSGEYVSFLDSDDIWASDKIEKQLSFMIKNDCDFSYGDYFTFKDDDNTGLFLAPVKTSYEDLLKTCSIGCLTVMLHKKLLINQRFPSGYKEDYQLWLRILKDGIIAANYGSADSYYRLGKNTLSSNKIDELKKQWYVIRLQHVGYIKTVCYLLTYVYFGLKKHCQAYRSGLGVKI
ncbi:glycosyltransferase family 2 protein [Escherichia coli]|nr:glycosyltransferase family 2 protein [Escherichia coli]